MTADPKEELFRKILKERLETVRGPLEYLNHSWENSPAQFNYEEGLKEISGKTAESVQFAQLFPEASFLFILHKGQPINVYSLVKNAEFKNISWILFENRRKAPEEDTLTISAQFISPSPNRFLAVEANQLPEFISEVKQLKNKKHFERFLTRWQISRYDKKFWNYYDFLNKTYEIRDPIEAGVIDLTRFDY